MHIENVCAHVVLLLTTVGVKIAYSSPEQQNPNSKQEVASCMTAEPKIGSWKPELGYGGL